MRVRRCLGEEFRRVLVEAGVFDQRRKIRSDDSYVYLPVLDIDDESAARLGRIADFEWVEMSFLPQKHETVPEDILGFKPSFEVVGDIAIVEDQEAEAVASALMSTSRSIKTVLAPISDVQGEFRTRQFRHVAGEVRTVTTHKEHGLRYLVDLEGAYFTPRLGTERLRVADQIRPGDVVLDMFAGVGPFSLLMARRGARVTAMDKNPVAVRYLRENARLNRIEGIEILEGDACELARGYSGMADHVIMNLPHSASQFLEPAICAARPGGRIHYYAIAPEEELYRDWATITAVAEKMGSRVQALYQGVVRSYAPRRHNVVIDFQVGI